MATGHARHLVNAFKYFSSFPVIYLSFLIGGNQASELMHLYWFAALALNFVMSGAWDLLIDWDLGYFKAKGSALLGTRTSKWGLRLTLLFTGPAYFYYLASLFNTIIRGAWIFRIFFIVFGYKSAISVFDSQVGLFTLQILEITRRFLWLILRTEVQHLNTSGKRLPSTSSNENLPEPDVMPEA